MYIDLHGFGFRIKGLHRSLFVQMISMSVCMCFVVKWKCGKGLNSSKVTKFPSNFHTHGKLIPFQFPYWQYFSRYYSILSQDILYECMNDVVREGSFIVMRISAISHEPLLFTDLLQFLWETSDLDVLGGCGFVDFETVQGGTSIVVPYCCLFLLSVFILWFTYYISDMF